MDKGGKHFVKGDDPRRNTTGANKGSRWAKTIFKELASIEFDGESDLVKKIMANFPGELKKGRYTLEELIIFALITKALMGEGAEAIAAIKEFNNRLYGKAKQEVAVEDDRQTKIILLPTKNIESELSELREQRLSAKG